eukprot:COSAG01_NODE_28971_length_648_cov_1.032787_2_plen_44_part_01
MQEHAPIMCTTSRSDLLDLASTSSRMHPSIRSLLRERCGAAAMI